MNPTFTISIDTEKRKAKASGAVAVGEMVDVIVSGLDAADVPEWEDGNDEGFSGPALRFRLVAPDGKDLVRFPLDEGDAWTQNGDGTLSAEVDFNTAELRHWLWGFPVDGVADVGVIVDSVVDAMEYGRGTAKIFQWAASPAEDPTILPDWRETLRKLNADILILQRDLESVEQSKTAAQTAATAAQGSANDASGSADAALRDAERAQGYKSDAEAAQEAAELAQGKAEEAQGKAEDAQEAAEGARDDAQAAAQAAEQTLASKADKSALDAEIQRALEAERVLRADVSSANDAISANTSAIEQLEEDKANKTQLKDLEDAIDAEATTREEKDAAICEKLGLEISNRESADATLERDKADKATTYTKTEVDAKIAAVQSFQKYIVQTLPDPETADMKGLYLVPTGETTEEGDDLCEEFTVVGEVGEKRWELIGGTKIDLSDYAKKDEVASALADKLGKITPLTHAALLALRTGGRLVPGAQYRITDYVATVTNDANARAVSHPFDIIVTADDERTLNERARAIQHEGDTYFASCDLAAWDVWYSIDNDANRFAWADVTNGRGVIYRLVDEFNNDVPYDFKGIQFLAYGDTDGVWRYTFDSGAASGNTDYSLAGRSRGVYGNAIAPYVYSSVMLLNCIVFKGSSCRDNTFGSSCRDNTFGSSCRDNTFGSYCRDNTFGSYCQSNTFGSGCNNIKFGTATTTKSYCRYIRVASDNRYLYINPTGTTSSSAYYQNVEIREGVNNTATYKTITDPNVGQTYLTTYKPANSQEISL